MTKLKECTKCSNYNKVCEAQRIDHACAVAVYQRVSRLLTMQVLTHKRLQDRSRHSGLGLWRQQQFGDDIHGHLAHKDASSTRTAKRRLRTPEPHGRTSKAITKPALPILGSSHRASLHYHRRANFKTASIESHRTLDRGTFSLKPAHKILHLPSSQTESPHFKNPGTK